MPGRFKDYIAVPKPNMYQSLHTTLIGPKGTPFEVQIRTYDMHRIAEFGIAAHWAYKEANKNKKQSVVVTEDKLAWLRETLEWQKDMQDPGEFLNTLKTELFEDEVYVFTPKGQIKVLPRGCTPIDFAYSIHEEIGHHMTGAKINNKMMPIITHLHNGDIIEIITSDQAKGPSRDWLKFVKSSTAKNRINQWYKKINRAQGSEQGRDTLEKEIKKLGIKPNEMLKPEWVQIVLDRYKFATIDDMYASIGYGGITVNKIIARFLIEYNKETQDEDVDKKIEELANAKNIQKHTSVPNSGVIVKGIDNCLVKLSKCCNPLPGDDIVGYITKGRGVSIHRVDCPNVKDLLKEESRMIDVYWYEEVKGAYDVDIDIYANDRNGLLKDVIKQIENAKAELRGVTAKATKEATCIINITVQVENISELQKILTGLRKIESVYEVSRRRG